MKFGRVVGVECRIGWLFGGQCGWIANFAVCGFIAPMMTQEVYSSIKTHSFPLKNSMWPGSEQNT